VGKCCLQGAYAYLCAALSEAPTVVTVEAAPGPKYRSKIIKAGALLSDTRTLFTFWDPNLSQSENLKRLHAANVFGKSSRSRVEDVLAIFRQRYMGEPGVANALSTLVQAYVPTSVLTPIFYFHAARNDRLLHDVVTEFLVPRQWQGQIEVTAQELVRYLLEQAQAGRTVGKWSEPTARRIAQGLLSTLRDFGVLSGTLRSPRKQLAPMYVPTRAFAYVAFFMNQRLRSGDRLLTSDEWRLYFLSPQLVERFFIEAEQERLLTYNAAGRIIRVDFPADSIEDYAHALAEGTH
jgi:hypothetical protein